MTDPGPARRLWQDRCCLRDVQYKTDANLAARQSIYAYQDPPVDLARQVLGLAELDRREHQGPVLGADLSPGMLSTCGACPRSPASPAPGRWSRP